MAINDEPILMPHTDNKDYSAGFCIVIPYGKFEGGELWFPNQNWKISTQGGEIIAFKSSLLVHAVAAVTGSRKIDCVVHRK